MKKQLLIMLVFISLISFASAQTLESLGTFEQGDIVRIKQVCSDATYINLSTISFPNSSVAFYNVSMISSGNGEFFFNYNQTQVLGRHSVTGISDGCTKTFATYLDITPSGYFGVENIWLIIMFIVFLYSMNLLGFFKGQEVMTIFTGMGLMVFGLYTINNGLIIYRDDLTRLFSMITIGWGFISTMYAAESYMDAI